MKSKAFVSVQLTYHISFSNRSIDCKLSALIKSVSPHFLPAYRERRTGGKCGGVHEQTQFLSLCFEYVSSYLYQNASPSWCRNFYNPAKII